MDYKICSEADMESLGMSLAQVLKRGDVVYLIGELGAGKTTLVRGVARGLGFQGRVTSPTFTLMNVYPVDPVIYHFDFYRLEPADLDDLGLEDYLEKGGIALIEWPQVESRMLPRDALWVEIELVDGDYERERQVRISAQGSQYPARLERLRQIADSRAR